MSRRGPGPPPPPRIKKKKVIRANFKLFHLYFATFCSRKYHILCYFLSWAHLEKLKKQKKVFQIFTPFEFSEFLDTPLYRDENKLPNDISLINKIKADLHFRYLTSM